MPLILFFHAYKWHFGFCWFPENLEALERGELKFSCYYDEAGDHFGDSCGSAESEEGSDSEPEGDNSGYINITTIKKENTDEDCDLEVSLDFSHLIQSFRATWIFCVR